jgi:hypothetical protein
MNGKKDCEKLMTDLLPLAEKMLKEFGEFYPYGGYMKYDGEIVHIGAQDEDTDHPTSKDLIHILRDSLSQQAKARNCRAAALLFDVCIHLPGKAEKSDAIKVCLEHVDGYSADVFLPYESALGRLTYGDTFAQQGERQVFGKPEPEDRRDVF